MKPVAIRLVIFKSKSCPHCDDMDRKKVIEKFVDKQFPPKIAVQRLDCLDADGEVPEKSVYETNFKLSDAYGVTAFPTVIIEGKKRDGKAIEIARMDSATVSAFTTKELERVFKQGMKALDQLEDDIKTQDEAAAAIPW